MCQEKVDGNQHDSECRHCAERESLPVFPPCFVSRRGRCHGDLVFYRRPRRQGADDALTWPCLFIKKKKSYRSYRGLHVLRNAAERRGPTAGQLLSNKSPETEGNPR